MERTAARPRLATGPYVLGLFLSLYVIWGLTYVIVKVGLHYAPPLTFATLRALVAGLTLSAYAFVVTRYFPRDAATHRASIVLGLFNVTGFLALLNLGLARVSAGESSILTYTQPLLVGVLAWVWLGESLSIRQVVGLLMGFGGVVAVVADKVQMGEHPSWLGYAYALGGAGCWGLATVYFRARQARVDYVWTTALQSVYGFVPLAGLALVLEGFGLVPSLGLVWTVAFNGLASSGVAYLVWFYLLRHRTAAEVTGYVFLVPFFAVVFGAALLGERLDPAALVGAGLILGGIYLVNQR